MAAPMRLNCYTRSVQDYRTWQDETNLGDFSKVFDDLAIALNNFLLNIESDLTSCFGCILDVALVQGLKCASNFQVGIRSR